MTLTDLLHSIFKRLDLRDQGALTVTADEIPYWPSNGLEFLVKWGMLAEAKYRTCIECDGCEEMCPMPVVVIPKSDPKGEQAFVICDKRDDIDIVPIEFDRLRQWKIDPDRIASLLNRLLKSDQTPQAIIQERLWRLGMVEIAGTRREVLFARGVNWADGDRIFDEIARKVNSTESFLFVPNDPRREDVQNHVITLSLFEALFIADDKLLIDVKLIEDAYLQNHQKVPTVERGIVEEMSKPTFRKEGENWILNFEGKTVNVENRDGLAYIAFLLHRPGEHIPILDLYYAIKGTPLHTEGKHYSKMSGRELEEYGLRIAGIPAPEQIDTKTLKEVKERLTIVIEEIEEAKSNNDLQRTQNLIEEREKIEHYLNASIGFRGRPRKNSDETEKARKAVSMAVRRSEAVILKEHESLGRYLLNHIHTGSSAIYTPESILDWQL